MKFRAAFDYDVKKASDETAIKFNFPDDSLTIQSDAIDADINTIVKRYGLTGRMPDDPRVPVYGDFSGITDYRSAYDALLKANEDFMALPADIRSRFRNDPQELLEFMENGANIDEARKLGLVKEKVDVTIGTGSRGVPVSGGPATATGRAESGDFAGQSAGAPGSEKASGK